MIKLKNILAENMRRFGVKNLSESDIHKINEAPGATFQPYGLGNPNSLAFKDEAAYKKATSIINSAKFALDSKAIAAGSLGPGFVQVINGVPTMNNDTNQSLTIIADAFFDIMIANGRPSPGGGWSQDIGIILKQADIASKVIRMQSEKAGSMKGRKPIDVFVPLTTAPANKPGMGDFRTMAIIPGKNDDKWQAIHKIILPILQQASALIIQPVKAAAPAAPGTSAPAKKN